MYKKLNAPGKTTNNAKHNKGGIMVLLVIITALLVGGVVYVWQQASVSSLNNKLNEVKSEAGNKLSELEVKVQDLEKEKEEKQKEEEEVDKWKTYTNNDYGFSFSYHNVEAEVDVDSWDLTTTTPDEEGDYHWMIVGNQRKMDFLDKKNQHLNNQDCLDNYNDYILDVLEDEISYCKIVKNDSVYGFMYDLNNSMGSLQNLVLVFDDFVVMVRVEGTENKDVLSDIVYTFKFLEVESNLFDINTAKVGDKVAGMEIVSIEPFKESFSGLSYENAKVELVGNMEINGQYSYNDILSAHCITNIEETLPKIKGDTRSSWFCFEDTGMVEAFTNGLEESDQIKVYISKYTINSFPSEVANMGRLVIKDW